MMGSVILIKPQQEVLINNYISIYLKTYEAWKELRRISGSSAQQAIYLAHLKKMRVMHPTDVTEQESIAKSFEGVDEAILQKEEKLKKLDRLKKALMQNLLTGKVRVKVPKK
jgi:type I restriction enzyme S subunit